MQTTSSGKSHSAEELLQRAMAALHVANYSELASTLGIAQSTLASWKARNSVNYELLIAKCEGVNLHWLLTGEGPMLRTAEPSLTPQIPPPAKPASRAQAYKSGFDPMKSDSDLTYFSREPGEAEVQDFALVKRVDARLVAGPGAYNADAELLTPLAFRRDWLKMMHLNPGKCVVLAVVGDSMEPTLYNGDAVLVDERDVRIERDGLYALALGSELRVKRVQRRRDGGVTLISDNPRYLPEELSPGELHELRSLGRVVWAGHEFRG